MSANGEALRASGKILESWSVRRLVDRVPGSSVKQWRGWTRELMAAKVLVKRGKQWLGRWADIEAALLQVGAR